MSSKLYSVVLMLSYGCLQSAYAQSSQSAPNSKFTIQGPAEQSTTAVVRDPLGRPCLDIEAAARAQVVNPSMMDHVVSVKNNCAKIVHAKVCYFNSSRCNEVTVQPYKRVDTILGTMRGVQFFRYSLTQK